MKLIDGHDVMEHAEVNGEDRDFIKKLIDYIEDADEVEPKTGDLISREDAIKAVSEPFDRKYWQYTTRSIRDTVKALKDIPSAEPKQGKWIRKERWSRGVGMGEVYGWYFECSACGCLSEGSVNDAGNFCPNCGCRMKGADDED